VTDIKALLKQYEEVNAELNKQISENGKQFLESVFQEIFDQNEGLKLIYIIGWTPGFNDGEPCTHSQESFVGSSHTWSYRGEECLSYDFDDRELYEEFEVEFDEEDSDTVVSHINSGCKTLDQVTKQVAAYEELVERVYNTNFEIKVTLNSEGKVVVDQDWYDCGY
jgi:hypothetical protein